MIIFLYGKDTYRLQQKLKEIENQYKKIHKSGLNLEKIAAEQIDFQEFWDKLFQQSMFIKKKLFFLENLFSNQKFKGEFLKKIQPIAKSQDIIVVSEKKELPQKDKLFQGLKKYGKFQEFKPLGGKKLKDWLEKEFQRYGGEIERRALMKLIDFVGNNLWQMSNEIRKLTSYKKEIKEEDVDLLVKPKIEADIFETIEALANKEKKRALRLVQKHLEKGDSPLYILSMINFQFRNLLILKSCESGHEFYANDMRILIEGLNLHPYVIKKTRNLLRNFSLEKLKKIYQRIFELDLDIKTGKIKAEEGLEMLITEI